MSGPLPGDWVVILGASSGFGAATAEAFAAAGHPILGAHLDRRATQPAADAVAARCAEHGAPVRFVNGNAADPRRVDEALDAMVDAHGDARVGVLVHSLAFGSLRALVGDGAAEPKHLDMTMTVMAHSLVTWVQALTRRGLLRTPGGRVFALTSAGSAVAWPGYGPVSAAKAALEAHVRQLAVELAPTGVTVNAVMPGVTRTPALDAIPDAERLAAGALARNPSGRLTEPTDVAACLVALASAGTSWMTGNVIRVDGGEAVAGG